MLTFIMLTVIMLTVIMLTVIMLNVIMLSIIMRYIVVLSVMAPNLTLKTFVFAVPPAKEAKASIAIVIVASIFANMTFPV
jgi:hypothetical protein